MPRATDGWGKTDDPRRVNKRKYDEGYVRAFGIRCPYHGLGAACSGCLVRIRPGVLCKTGKLFDLDAYEEMLKYYLVDFGNQKKVF